MPATRLLLFFKDFTQYYDRRFLPLTAEYGLSMREMHVLLFLANHPCYDTARDICEYRGISKSQVSQAVDFLSEIGFLTRETDSEDRRVTHLHLTPAGRTVAEKGQVIQCECMSELLSGMDDEQLLQIKALWEIILSNGERLAKEAGE